jgi:hypothetical protein
MLDHVIADNPICLSAVMMRRSCVQEVGGFAPRDEGAASWHMLCQLALRFPLAYLGAPMVNHRAERSPYTPLLFERIEGDLFVVWSTLRAVEEHGLRRLVNTCRHAIGLRYGLWQYRRQAPLTRPAMSESEFEASLTQRARSPEEERIIRAHAWSTLGNFVYADGDHQRATRLFFQALLLAPQRFDFWLKYLLAQGGSLGRGVLRGLVKLRDLARWLWPPHF